MKMHHAIVFEGDRENGLSRIHSHAKEILRVNTHKNPDFVILEHERFTIEHARALKERAAQAPLQDIQVFVVITDTILHEAQNALLKLFEEPPAGTHFYLLLPTARTLLPTVRSRLHFGGATQEKDEYAELTKNFLKAGSAERLLLLEPILSKKDRKQARKFLQSLEASLHAGGVRENTSKLQEIYFARQYISDRSSSVKMLLEHVIATV